MLANSYEPSSEKSSKPPAIITLALPDRIESQAISTDCRAVAQAPTGILIGPEAESRRRLTQPAVVLMNVSWRMSFCTSSSDRRSRNMAESDCMPPMPEPRADPTSDGWTYW